MTRRALRLICAVHVGLAAGFVFALARALVIGRGVAASDFTVFWTGWWLILHGRAASLYDASAQEVVQRTLLAGAHFQGGLMAFLNPPHAALAGTPFGWLADRAGEGTAFFVWTLGTLALLAQLDRGLRQAYGASRGDARWAITLALLAFYPIFETLRIGQPSLLLAVAVLGVFRAAEASRPRAGGAWLTVLTLKPQLLPAIVGYLVVRRCWRLLVSAAAMTGTAAIATATILGPGVWIAYVRHVGPLEHFFGGGTVVHMLNVRGALSYGAGFLAQPTIDAASFALWAAASAIVTATCWRRSREGADSRAVYAMAVGAALLFSPHLFVQDAAIWSVPVVLHAAARRDRGVNGRAFAAFALCFPLLFVTAYAVHLAVALLAITLWSLSRPLNASVTRIESIAPTASGTLIIAGAAVRTGAKNDAQRLQPMTRLAGSAGD